MLIFAFLFYNEPELWPPFGRTFPLSGLVGFLLTYLLVTVSDFTARLTHWKRQPGFSVMVSVILNTIIVFGVASVFLFLFYGKYLGLDIAGGVYAKLAIISFVVVLLYSVAYLVISSYQYLQVSTLETIQLEAKQVDLQLTSLKSQLTPHFLFNSLNTISSLLYKSPETTETYIRNLAKIYQYTLPAYDKKLVPFNEEWEYVQANLELLSVRFGDALVVELENETQLYEINMPPLTLQLLIENALKHNRISRENPLKVMISRKGQWWQVVNNITEKPQKVSSFKVGLRVIKERYELLGLKVKVSRNESFTVKLPVL